MFVCPSQSDIDIDIVRAAIVLLEHLLKIEHTMLECGMSQKTWYDYIDRLHEMERQQHGFLECLSPAGSGLR